MDYPAGYIKTNIDGEEIGDFTFQDLSSGRHPTHVEISIYNRYATNSDDKFEVWMWESRGGWEKVGELTPDTAWQWSKIDVTNKFNTRDKLNEAKMYLKYVEV